MLLTCGYACGQRTGAFICQVLHSRLIEKGGGGSREGEEGRGGGQGGYQGDAWTWHGCTPIVSFISKDRCSDGGRVGRGRERERGWD